VVNSGASSASYLVSSQSILYSLQTSGPTFASIGVALYIERFNSQTSVWDIIGATSFGLSTDQSNSACSPACTGGSSSYDLAGNSEALIRLHTRLQGSASQVAGSTVPEPSTLLLSCLAGAMGLLGRKVRRAL
jgi:hypothetical protein